MSTSEDARTRTSSRGVRTRTFGTSTGDGSAPRSARPGTGTSTHVEDSGLRAKKRPCPLTSMADHIKLARDRDRYCAPCRCRRTRGTGRLGCGRSRPRRGVRRRCWRRSRHDRGLAPPACLNSRRSAAGARRELSGERAIRRRRPADSRCGTQVASCGVRSPTVTGAQSVPGGYPESRTAAPEIAGSTARGTCPDNSGNHREPPRWTTGVPG